MIRIILFCTLLFFSGKISAQGSFEFGLRLNPQVSALLNKSDQNASGLKFKFPIHPSAGIAIGYNFNNHWGIELNTLISRQAQTYSGNAADTNDPKAYSNLVALQSRLAGETLKGTYQAKAEINCIKIPVMVKWATDNTKTLFFNIMAGPQLNIIYDVAQEVNRVDHDYDDLGVDPKDLYKKSTIDGVFAFGLGVNISSHFIFSANARFDYGFQDVENKSKTYTYQGTTHYFWNQGRAATHNTTGALSVGLSYRL